MRSVCHRFSVALLIVAAFSTSSALAQSRSKNIDGNGNGLDSLIAKHAAAHSVPEALVRRVIHRESRGNPRVISKGNYGLMQIRLGTARAMGYRGSAAGLLDADTNMTYAVK
jgi:soluble lytic murein transglycosylase-like protein